MAQYKHLPIYKTTYELLEMVTRKTKDFPRDFKYSLGDKIRNECIELVVFISVYDSMAAFVEQKLKVRFHPNKKEINRVEHGVNFVGYIIKPHCKYLRRSTIDNLYSRSAVRNEADEIRATVNSYFGLLRHANAYGERKRAAKILGQRGCWFDGGLTKMTKLGAPQCTFA